MRLGSMEAKMIALEDKATAGGRQGLSQTPSEPNVGNTGTKVTMTVMQKS